MEIPPVSDILPQEIALNGRNHGYFTSSSESLYTVNQGEIVIPHGYRLYCIPALKCSPSILLDMGSSSKIAEAKLFWDLIST